jgi:predicted helicase
VSNNGFLRGIAFDGFREHLASDFSAIYHFNFKGNARTTGELRRREGGNIFHDLIRCGVGITVLVRRRTSPICTIYYHDVGDYWKAEEKGRYLSSLASLNSVPWRQLMPDARHNWLVPQRSEEFEALIPLGTKGAKSRDSARPEAIFKVFSCGVKTNRDEVAYNFDKDGLAARTARFIDDYNGEVDRYRRSDKKTPVDEFVRYDRIKWSRDLKLDLRRGNYAIFDAKKIRTALYRPFCKRWLFFDRVVNEEVYVNPRMFPTEESERENCAVVTSDIAYRSMTPSVLASRFITDLHVYASDSHQCFPFYVYDEDGTSQRENVTDWALGRFHEHYNDNEITKWDIFYYVYAVLHHPEYRTRYAENLKRELPRIPLAKDFWGFSKAGKELARLHIDYEKLEPYPLKFMETTAVAASSHRHGGVKPPLRPADLKVGATIPLSYRVEDKMRLSKDRRSLKVNDSLTLCGIPPEAFEYRLGNRSALEWVIDQYQVTEEKHSGIRSDPNRAEDPEYIVRLVGQVIYVSLHTTKIVRSLPEL